MDDLQPPNGAELTKRLVAMVDVPPEQVPEGLLTVSRSHRSSMKQVRIVISSPEHLFPKVSPSLKSTACSTTTPVEMTHTSATESSLRTHVALDETSRPLQLSALKIESRTNSSFRQVPSSPSLSAMESAATIFAADEVQLAELAEKNSNELDKEPCPRDRDESLDDDTNEPPPRTYLVLVELTTDKAAEVFVKNLHGKPYTILDETVTCRVHHVVALQGEGGVSPMRPFLTPSLPSSPSTGTSQSGLLQNMSSDDSSKPSASSRLPVSTEVHNCAVCLERMDLDRSPSSLVTESETSTPRLPSSILTTVCNHSFHMECLLQWQDSPCPVCRYDHSGLNEALSRCHVCDTTENNYVCLICGVISCGGNQTGALYTPTVVACATNDGNSSGSSGRCTENSELGEDAISQQLSRMSVGHARQHYDETLHAYALDTETQHVWDFVGQGYVHRLLQNAKDDKLVEVNDPHNTSSYERNLNPGLSDSQEGEVVHRKLEGFASQYYTLLKGQLKQQRIYYEGQLEEIRREFCHGAHGHRKKTGSTAAELISALKQERNHSTQRCMTLRRKFKKVSEDVTLLKNMNESLEANKNPIKRQINEAQRERSEARDVIGNCLPALEEKVGMLMLQLEDNADTDHSTEGSGADKKIAARK